jgi:polyisoprenoid-binding protein YceI
MTTQTQLPPAGAYTVDALHSNVSFVVRHLVSKIRGHFSQFEGAITIGDTPETSSVTATVQVASISTDNEMRDGHLQSSDFLHQEQFPTLELKSTAVRAKGDGTYVLDADLTIRGVTKAVSFDLEFLGVTPGMQPDTTTVGFEAVTEIDRRDFGVSFEGVLDTGAVVVSNKVSIELNIEAHKQG